ncbi:MAG: tetratricopeptide repeat protein [Alphaproteobacteria bacterium]
MALVGAVQAAAEAPQKARRMEAGQGLAPSSFGSYLAGRHAERTSDLKTGADLLLRVLEESPEDEELLRRTFMLTLGAGRLSDARQLAKRIEAAKVDVPSAALLLAADAMRERRYADARKRLEAMSETGLARYAAPIGIAWSYAGEKRPDEAMTALKPLESQSGFKALYLMHGGLIMDATGRSAEAEEKFRAIADDLSEAPLRVVRAAGSFLERRGRKDEARTLYRSYIDDHPESYVFEAELERLEAGKPAEPLVGSPAEGMAEGLFNLASALPRDRAGSIALIYAQVALSLRPNFSLGHILIGDILMSREQYDAAIDAYRGVAASDTYSWAARLRVADALYEEKRVPEAVTLLEAMAAERKDRPDALVRLGNLLRYEERFAEAVKAYDRAFARFDKDHQPDWMLYYYRGIALERSKQWDRAEKDFLIALEREPEQPYVLNYLGYTWVELGRNIDRAKAMITRAVELRQDDGYIVDSMGWVLYRLGDYKEAVAHLERAVQLRPQDPVINDHLGDAYWRVGRQHEARFQWQRALSLEPEKDDVAKIETKLERGLEEAGGKPAGSGG